MRLRRRLLAGTGLGAFGLAMISAASSFAVTDGWPYEGVPIAQRVEPRDEVVPADRRPGKPDRDGLLGMTPEGLRDRTVYATTGEPVARIEDVVVLDDRVQLVLSVGGFLGVAAEEVALPIERFELRVDEVVLTRPVTEEELEELAPYPSERATVVPSDQELSLVRRVIRPPEGAPRSDLTGPPPTFVAARRDDVTAFYRDLPPPGAPPHELGGPAGDGRRSNQ